MATRLDTQDSESTTFDFGPVQVRVGATAGPRIVGYARTEGPDVFASLPDSVIEHPAIGTYRFIGGHRLWRAPEVPAVTYHPDDAPVQITEIDDGFDVVGVPDRDGVIKRLSLRQSGQFTIVDHWLDNNGQDTVRTAPWAITQLTPGGVAVLPQSEQPSDTDRVRPNRHMVLWPYTNLSDPEIEFELNRVVVRATSRPSKMKIGQPNYRGWMAYALGGELFIKWSDLHKHGAPYADLGASTQCYRDERFLELETLGPLVTLHPGARVVHREIWQLRSFNDETLQQTLNSLPPVPEGLER